jgi:uncharacterized RDD family membrane protein YckC
MAPLPPPPPTPPPSTATQVSDPLTPARRLPRLEDFPEAGPNALATFQQRGLARVTDELAVGFPVVVVLTAIHASMSDGATLTEDTQLPLLLLAGAFAVQVLYEVVAVALWGQSLGKWLTGIRVARYTDGGRPTWAQSALRCLLWAAPGTAGLGLLHQWAIGALPVFLSAWRDPLRRAWHDEAGGTIVVRTR